jgi:DNA-binding NtrC family response regulator
VLPHQLHRSKAIISCEQAVNPGDIAPLAQIEKTHILNAYRQLDGNKSQTARILGIGLNTLRRKLTLYGITNSKFPYP